MTGGASIGGHGGSDIEGGTCYHRGMSAALKAMTIDEFDGFRPVAMTGGTIAHEAIGRNLRTELDSQLHGSRCQTFGPTTKIEVAGRIRYPDALIVCSPLDRKATVVTDPVVVFEVLSDSTAHIDYFEKLREYTATSSIRRYVILDQDLIAATVFVRDGDRMVVETVARGEMLRVPEIDVEIPLNDLCRGVEPEQPPDAGAASG